MSSRRGIDIMGYAGFAEDTFEGFQVNSQKDWTTFKKQELKPKPFEDHDVDVKIDACGVCGSDVHTINGGWGDAPMPLCVGHEVVGKAVKVGSKVKDIKVGDRVGVGAQIWACLECKNCKSDQENYCPKQIATYGDPYSDGTIGQGGYASHIRAHEYFTFPIPDAIPDEEAAPMLCAGITTYSPLVRAGTGPGKTVAVLGIGGLGHFGILWAKALGATVYALSSTPGKEAEAKKLGADEFVLTTSENWQEPLAFEFDFILNCADVAESFDMAGYMSTLKVGGTFHFVGLPDHPLPRISAGLFAPNGSHMGGSHIGNRPEMLAMLELAASKKLKPIIQTIDISEAGCKEAVENVHHNKVRYRHTLVGFDKAFGKRE